MHSDGGFTLAGFKNHVDETQPPYVALKPARVDLNCHHTAAEIVWGTSTHTQPATVRRRKRVTDDRSAQRSQLEPAHNALL
ncbi:hypothetical protein BaRGS_00016096 [Batillaria attramentaria]|uniref:Uncharacterized protein n=1 Tax=Batillaria attramentaria TaxID=370345 RepID=A0ABD0KZJ9_9CAEN